MIPVRDKPLGELTDEELGTRYVQLKFHQLAVRTAEAAKAVEAELELVIGEMEKRDPRLLKESKIVK